MARVIGVVAAIACSLMYLIAQVTGVGFIVARFIGIDFNVGVFLGLIGVLFCSVLGGMKSVTWTQVAQYIILIISYLVPVVYLFAALYAMAGARYLGQGAFVACLVLLFGLVAGLWVWVEARHLPLRPLRRVGRAAGGLALVIVGAPALTLTPLFWLEGLAPPEANLDTVTGPLMALLLISLALVAAVNVVGGVVAVGRGLLASRPAHSPSR